MNNQPLLKSATIWGMQLLTLLVILFTFFGGKVFPELYFIQNPIGPFSGWTLICLLSVLWLAYINDVLGPTMLTIPIGFIFIARFFAGKGILLVIANLLLTTPLINIGSNGSTIINPTLIIAFTSTLGGMIGSWTRKIPIGRFYWNMLLAFIGVVIGLIIFNVLLVSANH